jgi:hypothetical protein
MPATSDMAERRKKRVNRMKMAVSRMLNRAQLLTQNAAIGNFPCIKKLEEPIRWSQRNQDAIDRAIRENLFKPLFNDEDTLSFN